ncbi:MAG: D-glycerate dehydrogenase [Thaumarchaeota archaeon]|nr:D-glycerate dehydrogenase [Nitrososphaerota archaeon]
MTSRAYVSSNEIPEKALAIVRGVAEASIHAADGPPSREELLREVAGVDGLLCMLTERIDGELLDAGKNLKIVSSMSVGYDHVDLEAATKRGVLVTNTPGVLTEATADTTLGLILAVARRIVEGDRYLRDGSWRLKWSPMMMVGRDVHGKTLGIYGMGRIGNSVARRATGFGMRIIYHNRSRDEESEKENGAEYRSKEELLRESDFLSVHVPLNAETRNSIGAKELAMMKPTAFLINTSRGGVVEERALVEALKAGTIAGAGLDVFEKEPIEVDNPLIGMKNVVLTPHIGSGSVESRTAMAVLAAENLAAGLKGERPPNLLNPETFKGRE